MSAVGGFLGGPVGSLITGGLAGLFGASSAKKQQQKQIDLAREQMRFQERMSSTSYQRAAKDLEAAGLNRVLALGGGASSPSGAMPNLGISPKERGLATAQQVIRNKEELRNVRANNELIESQSGSARALRDGYRLENRLKLATLDVYDEHPWMRFAQMLSGPAGGAVGSAYGVTKILQGLKSLTGGAKAGKTTTDIIKHGPALTRKIVTKGK